HPAAVPDAVFSTPRGEVALALETGFVDVFSDDRWTRVAAPGFSPSGSSALFTGPTEGWLAGTTGVGHWTSNPGPSPLVTWPEANRSPLVAVALPPGSDGSLAAAGALAVGLNGTSLRYDPSNGWLDEAVPSRESHINLDAVAFSG